jgi:hypothetical protein
MHKPVRLEAGESSIGIEIEIDSAQFDASVGLDTETDFDLDFDFDSNVTNPTGALCITAKEKGHAHKKSSGPNKDEEQIQGDAKDIFPIVGIGTIPL